MRRVYAGNGGNDEGQEKRRAVKERKEDGGRGSLMLRIGFLAGLGRGEKAGIEGGDFSKRTVLEPSSGSLGSLGSLGSSWSAWQQGSGF